MVLVTSETTVMASGETCSVMSETSTTTSRWPPSLLYAADTSVESRSCLCTRFHLLSMFV
jgi:hypothetical protein